MRHLIMRLKRKFLWFVKLKGLKQPLSLSYSLKGSILGPFRLVVILGLFIALKGSLDHLTAIGSKMMRKKEKYISKSKWKVCFWHWCLCTNQFSFTSLKWCQISSFFLLYFVHSPRSLPSPFICLSIIQSSEF